MLTREEHLDYDYFERLLKKTEFFENNHAKRFIFDHHPIERLIILFSLNQPMPFEELEERVRALPAFKKYHAFKHARERCHHEGIVLKFPDELKYKIENSIGWDRNCRLREILEEYKREANNPASMKYDIKHIFGELAEHCRLIEYERFNKDYNYKRSDRGDKLVNDLIQGLRSHGILEFHYDKENLFK